uniref:Uncharacterized protein n=1 Tax=Aegilops tauschii subsp. strangulata TaxID=200361 RepID=A0A453F0B3_AEGTS
MFDCVRKILMWHLLLLLLMWLTTTLVILLHVCHHICRITKK